MPIYEYECERCGRFENIEKIGSNPLSECPHCSAKGLVSKVEKLVSAAAFHLKGSGWYKTDYASTGNNCAAKTSGNGTESGKDSTGTAEASSASKDSNKASSEKSATSTPSSATSE